MKKFATSSTKHAARFAVLAAALSGQISAQSVFNTANTTNQWGVSGNWSPSGIPNSIGAQVLFNSPVGGDQIITSYGANRTIGVFTANNTSSNELSFTSTSSLTFDNTTGNAQLNIIGSTTALTRITSNITLTDNLDLNVTNTNATDNRGALSLSGVVSGSGRIIKTGAGTTSIAGSTNTYTGGLQINGGTIRITGTTGIGAAPASFNASYVGIDGGRLQYDGSSDVTPNSNIGFTLGSGNAEISVTNSGTYTIPGVITGAGSLTKTGSGVLALSASNTFTGGLTVNGGTVAIATTTSLGSSASVNTNHLVLGNGTLQFTGSGSFTSVGNRGMRVGDATSTFEVTNAATALTLTNAVRDISGKAGVLTKSGNGTLVLNRTDGNTYTGGTVITAGTLLVTNGNLTASGTGSGPVTVGSGTTLGGNGSIAGNVALNSATIGSAGNTLALAGNLTTTGASNVAASSSVNVAGTTTVSTGTFTLNGTLGGSGNVLVSPGAALVGNATLSGATTLPAGGSLGVSGNTLSLGSTLSVTGTNSIVSGATLNVSGNTTVSAGVFSVNGTLGGSGAKFVTAGATLGGNGTILGVTTIGDSATLAPGNSPGLLTFDGDLTFNHVDAKAVFEINGTGRGSAYDAVNISGALAYDGDLTVSFGYSPSVPPDTVFNLFDFATESGDFDSISIAGTYTASLSRAGDLWSGTDAGGTVAFSFDQTSGDLTVSAIPEPSAFAILSGFSAIGLAALRRRRVRA
jgi:autotransporter-associated beta strand protein